MSLGLFAVRVAGCVLALGAVWRRRCRHIWRLLVAIESGKLCCFVFACIGFAGDLIVAEAVVVGYGLVVEDDEAVTRRWPNLGARCCPCSGDAFVGFAGMLAGVAG